MGSEPATIRCTGHEWAGMKVEACQFSGHNMKRLLASGRKCMVTLQGAHCPLCRLAAFPGMHGGMCIRQFSCLTACQAGNVAGWAHRHARRTSAHGHRKNRRGRTVRQNGRAKIGMSLGWAELVGTEKKQIKKPPCGGMKAVCCKRQLAVMHFELLPRVTSGR